MRSIILLLLLFSATSAYPQATSSVPVADKAGSRDHRLLKRYEGSLIISYDTAEFDAVTLPLSELKLEKGKKDGRNNSVYAPSREQTLEGRVTRLVYLLPEGRSNLEVLRNYQQEIQSAGGEILFECKGEECGGDASRSSNGGGGRMSLTMYLHPASRVTDERDSPGHCARTMRISDQHYTAAELPASDAYVSVLAYRLRAPLTKSDCTSLADRTVALVDVVETKPREQRMVVVSADEISRQIAGTGSIALYGIHFDSDQATLKPESEPALNEIAKALQNQPALSLLVVGHTDNQGTYLHNLDLSKRRAEAVKESLVTRHGIDTDRLLPVGVSFASPLASNQTEEGRAKNRRVQLVEDSN